VEAELADWELATGDTLLLCSDGLTRHLSDERILAIVAKSSTLAAACEELTASANEAGGSDNITCLLVRVV
jgi:protein phosphatase